MMKDRESIQDWEQVRVEVAPELAELTVTALTDILPGSLVVEQNFGDLFPHELDQSRRPVQVYGYFPAEKDSEIRARILAALKEGGVPGRPEFSPLENENWATAWQERYQPVPLGDRLIVVPTWLDNPQPERLAIFMDPGGAFGSGTHSTTQLSLELLESCVVEDRPDRMIDLGCGSGILSITGAKLGVEQVLGVDTDPDAIQISRENAAANRVSGVTSFQQGSVKEILEGKAYFQKAPLVVANIIAPILISLFEDGLGEMVLPQGKLVLSGILEEQTRDVVDCFAGAGFTMRMQRQRQEWIGLVGEK